MDKHSAFGEKQSHSLLFSTHHLSRGTPGARADTLTHKDVRMYLWQRISVRSHAASAARAEVALPSLLVVHIFTLALSSWVTQLRGMRDEGFACGD